MERKGRTYIIVLDKKVKIQIPVMAIILIREQAISVHFFQMFYETIKILF
jgi:hypothetical protein